MFKAIGYNSGTLYATGKTRADVLRTLQEAYPNPKNGGSERRFYPEPLILIQ